MKKKQPPTQSRQKKRQRQRPTQQKKKNKDFFTGVFSSPLGKIGVAIKNDALVRLDFASSKLKPSSHSLIAKIQQQLNKYFKGAPYSFDFPINLSGTNFQKKVWAALTKIPAGKVVTYGELAKQLKSSARAIGNACRKNPIPIIIPCHRVVAKNSIGGYSGKTAGKNIKTKKMLLAHDKKTR